MSIVRPLFVVLIAFLGACATTNASGLEDDAPRFVGNGRLAVLVFFSQHCPTQKAHDARLIALADRFSSRAVRFFAIASEAGFDETDALRERQRRGYPFPIVVDRGARIADAVGARFSTHAVVIDAAGRILYRGGIDSDSITLHDDAKPWLALALEALLEGRVAGAGGEPRGCVLARP